MYKIANLEWEVQEKLIVLDSDAANIHRSQRRVDRVEEA